MPSNYNLSGFSFYSGVITGDPIIDYNAELVVTAPTNGAYVQYSTSGPDDDPYFDFSGNTSDLEVTASGFFNDFDIVLSRDNAAVFEIPWNGSTTDVLALLLPFGTITVISLFPLGGASTTHIDTYAEFLPFVMGFSDFTLIDSGQFAPDQQILLSEVDLLSATEIPKPDGLVVIGTEADDLLVGDAGDDRLLGDLGQDTLNGGDGADTLNGGDGDDLINGGSSPDDERDLVYAGAGSDSVDGGYGNDLIYGMGGNDTLSGGFGADELQGQDGNDVITGSALSDLVYGGAGDDFVNGGFGHDRINGGDGADKFYHLGISDHGSDWLQDYNAAEGDVLLFGNATATEDDFQVNFTETAGAGDAGVAEAFVIYKPTDQIIWALIDGADQDEINLKIGGDTFDLLG
jgi:Ca2+-binding RTX toxin-like protein